MKVFFNILKLIASIIIVSLVVLGIVMIVRNISSLTDAFNGSKQTVIGTTTGGIKNVKQVISSIESIVF